MLKQEDLTRINNKVRETVEKLNSIYNFGMAVPSIHYDVRGTKAGLAKSKTMSIHFNSVLAMENTETFIQTTVPHEVCHIAVWHWARYFRKPFPSDHGPLWKKMMTDVGANPKRNHSYDVSSVKRNTKTYEYTCLCETPIELSSIIHGRILKGRVYRCRKCRQSLSNGILKPSKKFSFDISSEKAKSY